MVPSLLSVMLGRAVLPEGIRTSPAGQTRLHEGPWLLPPEAPPAPGSALVWLCFDQRPNTGKQSRWEQKDDAEQEDRGLEPEF